MDDQAQDFVTVTIDGVELKAPRNAMLIEIADQAGINIPRFCYHKHLSVAANCRMCMVEVEKAPKPLPACATPVADGMQVHTRSELALDAQKGTMEFLLINHPLDCPVCDQGGECELQDVAMGYGSDVSRFNERKRVVEDKNIGPLVSTDMTRCIHCTRCVRFGTEIAGVSELGATGRGEFMEIGTYVEKSLSSELSGNVIDLCPVGALNAKPSRMKARAWEMVEHTSISTHDSFGSNLNLHTLRDEVIRVVPHENEQVNETWISDRDRFSYEGMYSDNRLLAVMQKQANEWKTSSWSDAIPALSKLLKSYSPDDIGFIVSANQTNEELFLVQKLARELNIFNIDHRIQQTDFNTQQADPVFPWLGMNIDELESHDLIIIIGSDLRSAQPMLAHKVRKATRNGAHVVVINPQHSEWHMNTTYYEVVSPQTWLNNLLCLLSELDAHSDSKLPADIKSSLLADEEHAYKALATMMLNANKSCLLVGELAQQHYDYSSLRAISYWIAQLTDSKFGYITQSSNAAGASLLGVLPHRDVMGQVSQSEGLNYLQMIDSPRKVYLLIGFEPEWDCALPAQTLAALNQADAVIALSSFVTEQMRDYCDWLLPINSYAEVEGTKVNIEGRWQTCNKAVNSRGEAKQAWKVLRMLGAALQLESFSYLTIADVQADISNYIDESFAFNNELTSIPAIQAVQPTDDVYCVGSTPIYSIDPLVRNAHSLQQAQQLEESVAYVHVSDIEKYNLVEDKWVKVVQGEQSGIFKCVQNNNVLPGTALILRALPRSETMGAIYGPVTLVNLSVA